MNTTLFSFPMVIQEHSLDAYGHVNNAHYLTLFEEARHDVIEGHGWGIDRIIQEQLGPVILEINIKYLKELRLHDEVIIETQTMSYEKKIGKIGQKIVRGEELCCAAEFTVGLFDLKERKLVLPTDEWLEVIGWSTKGI